MTIHLSIHPFIHPSINLYIQIMIQLLPQLDKYLLMGYYILSSTYVVISGKNHQKITKNQNNNAFEVLMF
jgi:hypothetical protein